MAGNFGEKEKFKLGLKHWTGTAIVAVLAGFVIFGLLKGQEILNDFLKSEPTDANFERGEFLVLIPSLIPPVKPLPESKSVIQKSAPLTSLPSPASTPKLTSMPSLSPLSTSKSTPTSTLTPTRSPIPTLTPTPIPMPTSSPTSTLSPTPTPIPSSSSGSTPSASASPTPTPTLIPTPTPSAGAVVINEIAWMGTLASQYAEWVELYNSGGASVDVSEWALFEAGGNTKIIALQGFIGPYGYFLIERVTPSSPDAITDIPADVSGSFGGSGLSNSGEYLVLKDSAGNIMDSVDGSDKWLGSGIASPDYRSMERINPNQSGSNPANWKTNGGVVKNGLDKDGNQINGTPRQQNSPL